MSFFNGDRQRIRNEDLVLKVSTAVDRSRWDESRYEAFLDELCQDREYQKEAIRTALRFLLGSEYKHLESLAKQNYEKNGAFEIRHGTWAGMKRHLQFPHKLAASLDLATGTGKSYVLYGIAAIMLAEGVVDRVLVLCPSTTIEISLLEKFRDLAGNNDLRDQLPNNVRFRAPNIIKADQTILESSICVENYHAILERTGSSIRDSLFGKGATTLILNDEAHHVANEPENKAKKWKEFLTDPSFGFHYIIGVSGTCYVQDDYFSDVIFRYSLRQAIEERRVKTIEYVAEMPMSNDPEERWQLINNRHEEIRRKLKRHNLLPLTIIVTQTIVKCKDVSDELKSFLIDTVSLASEEAESRVMTVYNNAPDVHRLPYIDNTNNKVEWIVSVSMLNEGWDVKRVFQIVPHEQRAFNSKLLIAQVLGRGLRIPDDWTGPQPELTVFNHEAWASSIKHLVNEVLEIEKRLSSHIIQDSAYHFDLYQLDYIVSRTPISKAPKIRPYSLFEGKDYINLADDVTDQDVKIEFERVGSESRYTWQTQIHRRTYTPREIAEVMFERLEQAQDPNDPDLSIRTYYTDQFPVDRLEQIVKKSLERKGMNVATENMKQKFLRALGVLRRGEATFVRFTMEESKFYTISTVARQADSVSAAELRRSKTCFWTDQTRSSLIDEQAEFFDEATEQASGYRCFHVHNRMDFKTPLNATIADSENERKFIKELIDPSNVRCHLAWIKSTAMRFYEVEYAWRKGEHTKRGRFSPDFFIRANEQLTLVVEIKDDSELEDPEDENRAKNKYTIEHFNRINEWLIKQHISIQYQFNFLTPIDFSIYFQKLRQGEIRGYQSRLDVKLLEG